MRGLQARPASKRPAVYPPAELVHLRVWVQRRGGWTPAVVDGVRGARIRVRILGASATRIRRVWVAETAVVPRESVYQIDTLTPRVSTTAIHRRGGGGSR